MENRLDKIIPRYIQNLVLSGDLDNLRLATVLFENPSIIWVWFCLNNGSCVALSIPFLDGDGYFDKYYDHLVHYNIDNPNIDSKKAFNYFKELLDE